MAHISTKPPRRWLWCNRLSSLSLCLLLWTIAPGCAIQNNDVALSPQASSAFIERVECIEPADVHHEQPDSATLVAYQSDEAEPGNQAPPENGVRLQTLPELEAAALASNPTLDRLGSRVAAAQARANYVGKLPDPTLGTNIFGHPIETAAGSQRANVTLMQMIPWLARLEAKEQQAALEALSLDASLQAEKLRVIGDVRAYWFRLYVLNKQIEINEANQEVLERLIEVANARVSIGQATQGDVLLGTVELSKLEEQILAYQQQLGSAKAELNRVIGRDSQHPIEAPEELPFFLPEWSHDMLRQLAWDRQPEIAAAVIETQATLWGVEVARLQRRPDVTLGFTWFAIDDNRPPSTIVDIGEDAWSFGAQVTLPIWHHKYDAIENEAAWRHTASHASVDETMDRYDALLRDLWLRATTAYETAQLYEETILPQARQTLDADLSSYSNGIVDFERVVRDFRNLLTLELGYHRSIGELSIALARIQQAIGEDLPTLVGEPCP